MADFSYLDNKVSLEDIEVDKHKEAVAAESLVFTEGYNNHEITFKIDNSQTTYNLAANTNTFADWGSFTGSPQNILAKQTAEVCKCHENPGFWTGAAGMIGFSMSANSSKVYLRFACTDPYWSRRDNRTMVELASTDSGIDQDNYNRIYHWGGSASIPFDGKTLSVTSTVGTGAECTATFYIKVT
ncbi:hypothetical protein B0I35DRAFT_483573 [Stachybotrys elegans]|uniref:Uncharacterized protein n=1 Tax=Stachybotrys elegans TaxID=80388 RepID=A0A8K0SBM3_9HYPO|nr:hypothetical protein B0I35DRAFT_483573 [Stachybotrys elegans]